MQFGPVLPVRPCVKSYRSHNSLIRTPNWAFYICISIISTRATQWWSWICILAKSPWPVRPVCAYRSDRSAQSANFGHQQIGPSSYISDSKLLLFYVILSLYTRIYLFSLYFLQHNIIWILILSLVRPDEQIWPGLPATWTEKNHKNKTPDCYWTGLPWIEIRASPVTTFKLDTLSAK